MIWRSPTSRGSSAASSSGPDYLPKPFNKVLLRARIGASLERKRYPTQAAHLAEIDRQRQRPDSCLHAILPAPAADELETTDRIAPDA